MLNPSEKQEVTQAVSQPNAVPVLLVSVCIIASCGILYELLISTISSYFLGSSVLHFSITIGLFLSFMGVGAYLSKFFSDKYLLNNFIGIEILLGVVGGASGLVLYSAYAFTENYYLIALLLIAIIGSLVGLEIPLLTRIVKNHFNLKDTLAQVLSFDYLGALIASVLFPLFLLPYLGLMRTSFFIGLLNLAVGFFNLLIFKPVLQNFWRRIATTCVLILIYIIGYWQSFGISNYLEQFLYQDEVIFAKQSPYQRIVLTRWAEDIRLYLNGNLQFSSADEHRYHEPLVHIPIALAHHPERVLLMGAGDGLAAREILKHEVVKQIDLVDLDPAMTELGRNNVLFKRLNQNALNNPKVKIYNEDAYKFLENSNQFYDIIIIDLPDPNDLALGKLYTKEFYELVKKRLSKDGIMVTQSTSPFFARKVFWCIHHTLEAVFPSVIAFNAHVYSFGQWGFNIAAPYALEKENQAQVIATQKLFDKDRRINLRYLDPQLLPTLFVFDKDVAEVPTLINQLHTQVLLQYYEESWLEQEH